MVANPSVTMLATHARTIATCGGTSACDASRVRGIRRSTHTIQRRSMSASDTSDPTPSSTRTTTGGPVHVIASNGTNAHPATAWHTASTENAVGRALQLDARRARERHLSRRLPDTAGDVLRELRHDQRGTVLDAMVAAEQHRPRVAAEDESDRP